MRWQSFWVSLVVLTLAAAGARAQKAYTIKLKHDADAGKRFQMSDTEKQDGTLKTLSSDGKVLKEDRRSTVKEEVFFETTLERGAKRPVRFKRTYEKATIMTGDRTVSRSFEGRTVFFELKEGKYQARVEGDRPLRQADLDELTRKANERDDELDDVFLPARAVEVGERWSIDSKALAAAFARIGKLDPTSTSGEATLLRVEDRDARPFGIIEVRLKLGVKEVQGLKFEVPAAMDMKMTLATGLDGSSTAGTLTRTSRLMGRIQVEDRSKNKYIVEINLDMSGRQARSAEQ
jgi:hypothetical protein